MIAMALDEKKLREAGLPASLISLLISITKAADRASAAAAGAAGSGGGSDGVARIVPITQAAYDALGTKVATTLYLITG